MNITNQDGHTALMQTRQNQLTLKHPKIFVRAGLTVDNKCVNRFYGDRDFLKILFAAGHDIESAGHVSQEIHQELIPDTELSLMHLCREAIRNHLLQMSNVNLFIRVPRLPLPKAVQSYLLYDQTLGDVFVDDDDDDDQEEEDFDYDYD